MRGEDTACITVEEILREKLKAILVLYEGKEYWLPRSQILGYDGNQGDKNIQIEVEQWILEEKGMV